MFFEQSFSQAKNAMKNSYICRGFQNGRQTREMNYGIMGKPYFPEPRIRFFCRLHVYLGRAECGHYFHVKIVLEMVVFELCCYVDWRRLISFTISGSVITLLSRLCRNSINLRFRRILSRWLLGVLHVMILLLLDWRFAFSSSIQGTCHCCLYVWKAISSVNIRYFRFIFC